MRQDFEITVKSTDNFRDELKTLFKTNEAYKGEETRALIQSLSVVDKILNFKNKQDMKFPKDIIDIKLKMQSDTYDLEIPIRSLDRPDKQGFYSHYEINHKSKKSRVGAAAKKYKKYPANFG